MSYRLSDKVTLRVNLSAAYQVSNKVDHMTVLGGLEGVLKDTVRINV